MVFSVVFWVLLLVVLLVLRLLFRRLYLFVCVIFLLCYLCFVGNPSVQTKNVFGMYFVCYTWVWFGFGAVFFLLQFLKNQHVFISLYFFCVFACLCVCVCVFCGLVCIVCIFLSLLYTNTIQTKLTKNKNAKKNK